MFDDLLKGITIESLPKSEVEINPLTDGNLITAFSILQEASLIQANSIITGEDNSALITDLMNKLTANIKGYVYSTVDTAIDDIGKYDYKTKLKEVIEYSRRTDRSYLDMSVTTCEGIQGVVDTLHSLLKPDKYFDISPIANELGTPIKMKGVEIENFEKVIDVLKAFTPKMTDVYDSIESELNNLGTNDLNVVSTYCHAYMREFKTVMSSIMSCVNAMYTVIAQMSSQIK